MIMYSHSDTYDGLEWKEFFLFAKADSSPKTERQERQQSELWGEQFASNYNDYDSLVWKCTKNNKLMFFQSVMFLHPARDLTF